MVKHDGCRFMNSLESPNSVQTDLVNIGADNFSFSKMGMMIKLELWYGSWVVWELEERLMDYFWRRKLTWNTYDLYTSSSMRHENGSRERLGATPYVMQSSSRRGDYNIGHWWRYRASPGWACAHKERTWSEPRSKRWSCLGFWGHINCMTRKSKLVRFWGSTESGDSSLPGNRRGPELRPVLIVVVQRLRNCGESIRIEKKVRWIWRQINNT